jgi:LPS-assembly lipoprotein
LLLAKHIISKGKSIAIVGLLALTVASCGFRPLYAPVSDGTQSASITNGMAKVAIPAIQDRLYHLVRKQLILGVTPRGEPTNPRFQLNMVLRPVEEGLAIQQDETISRYNFRLTANFTLVDLEEKNPKMANVLVGQARSIGAYNVVNSQFATLSAKRDVEARTAKDLADDIRLQLAVFFERKLLP